MTYTNRDRIIALAGIYQAACLTQQIARSGVMDSAAGEISISSLFALNPESVEAVYGGTWGIKTGLKKLYWQLQGGDERDVELTRYVIALMELERKLSKKPEMLQKIGQELEACKERQSHFHLLHSNILAQIAALYAETISTIKPQIMVQGEPIHLQNPDNANKIRAMLLAGIRSAMLWRQVGGKRRWVIFARKRMLEEVKQLLESPSVDDRTIH